MKVHSFITLSILTSLLFFASCGSDEDPEIELFTINVAENYFSGAKYWAVAYDINGEVVAWKEAPAGGGTVKLSSSAAIPDNKITVVIIFYSISNGGNKSYYSYAYTDIAVGSVWNMVHPSGGQKPGKTGVATINISSPLSYPDFSISNKYGDTWSTASSPGLYPVDIFHDKLNVVYRSGGLKHKMLTGVKSNDVISLTPADFVEYDTKVTFNLPGPVSVFSMVRGYESDWKHPNYGGYLLDLVSTQGTQTISSFTTGYISSMASFMTYISASYPGGPALTYYKIGAIPSPAIPWPDASKFVISNRTLASYTAAFDKPITWRITTWSKGTAGTTVNWAVSSPSMTHKLKDLPSEIISDHPDLALSNANHVNTTVYLGGASYETMINYTFRDEVEPSETEVIYMVRF